MKIRNIVAAVLVFIPLANLPTFSSALSWDVPDYYKDSIFQWDEDPEVFEYFVYRKKDQTYVTNVTATAGTYNDGNELTILNVNFFAEYCPYITQTKITATLKSKTTGDKYIFQETHKSSDYLVEQKLQLTNAHDIDLRGRLRINVKSKCIKR